MRVLVSGGGGVANQSRESEIHGRQVGDRTRSGRDMLIKKKKKRKKKKRKKKKKKKKKKGKKKNG